MSGFTQVPNDVLDHLMAQLDPYTFKVYLTIIRQTTGWHRTSCQISLTQFQQFTGIKKRNVIVSALRELEQVRLITSQLRAGVTTGYQLVTTGYHLPVTHGYQSPVTTGYPLKEKEIKEWEETKVRLATMMSPTNYSTYFRGLELVSLGPKTVVISAPSQAISDYVKRRCLPLIRKALGREVEITVEVQIMRTDLGAITG